MVEKAVLLAGLRLSGSILMHTLAAASTLVQQRSRIVLTKPAWDEFVALLDAEREPTEAAVAAAKRYNAGTAESGRYHSEPRA